MKVFLLAISLVFCVSTAFSAIDPSTYNSSVCVRDCHNELYEKCDDMCDFRNMTDNGDNYQCLNHCIEQGDKQCLSDCSQPTHINDLGAWLNQ